MVRKALYLIAVATFLRGESIDTVLLSRSCETAEKNMEYGKAFVILNCFVA